MEKQELIKKIDLQTFAYPDEPPEGFEPTIAYKKGFNSCAEVVINLIEQLDEPTHDKCYEKMADYEKQISDLERQIEEMEDRKPQKVKVPKFVAEWIELCKEKADLSSCLNGYYEIGDGTIVRPRGLSETFYDWLSDYDHMHDLARAYLDGYEVEEEPKWKIINDDKYCLTSIEAGYGNSLHWAFDSTKKKPILFDNEETAMYTAYITGGTVENVVKNFYRDKEV